MTDKDINLANVFARGIHQQLLEKSFLDGIEVAVELYYDNFTDATELDGAFLRALGVVAEGVSIYEEDLHEAINDAESRYCSAHASRVVMTPGLSLDEDDEEENG